MSREYKFRIDAFSPETIPMARLAEYMADLSNLLGFKHAVHFTRLEGGSTVLVHTVDSEDVPKVEQRVREANRGDGPPDALKAIKSIDDRLADDNAVGRLSGIRNAEIIKFPGRERPKPLEYGAFRERATLQGQLVRIGGRDITSHATIQDGDVYYSKCELPRELARELSPLLYGPSIRLFGSGRWKRDAEGEWELLQFTVEAFDVLDDAPLSDAVSALRGLLPDRETRKDDKLAKKLRSDDSADK